MLDNFCKSWKCRNFTSTAIYKLPQFTQAYGKCKQNVAVLHTYKHHINSVHQSSTSSPALIVNPSQPHSNTQNAPQHSFLLEPAPSPGRTHSSHVIDLKMPHAVYISVTCWQTRLIDWVKVLRPTRHKIGHFGDIPQANLLAWYGKTKPNTTKARIHQSKEMYYNTK